MADHSEISQVIQQYFDGLYQGDATLLKQAFSPDATICGYGGDGGLKTLSLKQFLELIGGWPVPKENGEDFDMTVDSIDITGTVASAKVRDLYQGRDFTDYLSLVKTPKGWRIFGKVFHSEAQP